MALQGKSTLKTDAQKTNCRDQKGRSTHDMRCKQNNARIINESFVWIESKRSGVITHSDVMANDATAEFVQQKTAGLLG
jgi:hypothetical protein